MLGDLVFVDDLPGTLADLAGVSPAQATAGTVHAGFDLLKLRLGRGQELCAFAGALGGDGRVAAHDEPLAFEQRRGDLREVDLVEQRQLQVTGVHQRADLHTLRAR